ncbi:hypothetical protein A6V39_00545 [Candidatus Mycoplasma haematobovis]|uniref:Uncharacterized protein n=1 Tax=Candidatus Mycoplasma haematobovis TaxID=432608 RepID=A0A1A9QFQ1_9MOLU|nr:hypothetical protein [Candidatus Mycoplasma haematobovis]OAL10539.1 hypothetical protein A6V39_00545 [Candidatus Mycoplasma haematobovis]
MALNIKYIALAGGGTLTSVGGGFGIHYLSKDKTVRDKLISSGEELISTEAEYQAVFKVFKNEAELTTAISKTPTTITAASSEEDGGNALETWCNESLSVYLTDSKSKDLITKTKKYCTKAPTKIKDKLIKKGKKLVTDWSAKLTKIKTADGHQQLLSDLQTKNRDVVALDGATAQLAVNTLEIWFNENMDKQLATDTRFEIETKVNTRCFEE